jgi:outer membrane protein assembly factor BamD (BamD/ComL family)
MTNNNYNIYNNINTIRSKRVWITLSLLLWVIYLPAQNYSEIQLANEYFLKGEKKKALELYRDLSKDDASNLIIYNNYFNLLLDANAFEEAQNYLKRNSRKDPENFLYKLDAGFIYIKAGDLNKADKYFKELINQNKANIQRTKMIAEYFTSRSLTEYGVIALIESRETLGNPYLFCLDLAMLYRIQGNMDNMVHEYLNYVTQNSANIQYVKNVLQTMLTKPAELESLEKLLYDKIQQFPDVEVYSDLLIWVTIQQKNFYAAFIQARSYDKRYKRDGEKCMEVARVAMDNGDYVNASKIYRYVIREFTSSQNKFLAGLGLLRTREAQIKNTFPVKADSVKSLLEDYDNFIKQFPENPNAWEASRNQAILYANYLDQKDHAIEILNQIIANPKASWYLKAKTKLDLGDTYLRKEEPWESTLLYSQVEKTQKDSPIGYEAKLKNAKLSYFRGDFRLAEDHLNILKEATTREIANDALDLSLRIKENLAFDSLGEGLKEYAQIELLLFQNKIDLALEKIELLKEGKVIHKKPNGKDSVHTINNLPILDDALWLEAKIRLQKGEFENSIALLKKIQQEFPDEVLTDDAMFLEAEILERHLNRKEEAMNQYREFLNKFPGSVYAAEARKRFRTLRGDYNGQQFN